MGAGPSGISSMNIKTGEIKYVVSVPFQIGHIQTNPWVAGEIVFCWETGGKSPQRTWTVMSDGSGLRPLYPESEYKWVTHEAVTGKDEVAIAIMVRQLPNGALTEKGLDEAVLKKIAALNGLTKQRNQTMAQMAIAWLLKDTRITSVLVGASSAVQLLNSVESIKNIDFSTE